MDPELRELESTARRHRSVAFLGVLAVLLAAMGATVLEQAYPALPGQGAASGEIRPVPPAVLRSQLQSGRLSDREADHWRVEPREKAR